MVDVVLRNRDIDSGQVSPDRFGAPFVCGSIAYVSWVSASDPTAEVLDQSTAQLVSELAQGVTLNLTNGTIEVLRDGVYEMELVLAKFSSASASGIMNFTIQKNSAALTNTITCGVLQPAVAANHMSAGCKGVAALVKGDLIRVVFTGSVGGVMTLVSGRLIVRQRSDASAFSQV